MGLENSFPSPPTHSSMLTTPKLTPLHTFTQAVPSANRTSPPPSPAATPSRLSTSGSSSKKPSLTS